MQIGVVGLGKMGFNQQPCAPGSVDLQFIERDDDGAEAI
jgi:hypothetical protein